jgi:hypothetical protein
MVPDPVLVHGLGFSDGPASGEKGSNGRNYLDCIRGKGVRAPIFRKESVSGKGRC